jgi:hypothetical protein
MVGVICFAAIGSALATLAMRGRLMDFGVFAVGVALTGFARHGGDLTTLLQYQAGTAAARGSTFGWSAVDALLWTIVPVVSLTACAITGTMAGLIGPVDPKLDAKRTETGPSLLTRWLARSAHRTGTAADWRSEFRRGAIAFIVTTVVAMVAIRFVSGRSDAPVNPGQACFAVFVGFWLGALISGQFARPALGIWVCLAVPVVAVIGYAMAAIKPDLTGPMIRYAEVAIIAPNALVRALPVDYLSIGPAAAILGNWTAQRFLRAREEAAES